MAHRHDAYPGDTGHHRTELAQSLVDCLGVAAAIHACRENCWAGVLDAVIDLDREQLGPLATGTGADPHYGSSAKN